MKEYGIGAFLFLEFLILIEACFALRDKLFNSGQRRQTVAGKKIAYFVEHWGVWGNLFIVSPFVGCAIWKYGQYWKEEESAIALFGSLLITLLMVAFWCEPSTKIDEPFCRDARLTTVGRLHCLYMWPVLTVILLFFDDTPKEKIVPFHLNMATIGLLFHFAMAILQPDAKINGKISRWGWAIGLIVSSCLVFMWWRLRF